mmetsp:Transcript_31673/g.77668  ORF Transcript_31673/g.77668 Transcript_31673/m.77668 type:complete len:275 (+) Transcript_31673:2292-3116(+)
MAHSVSLPAYFLTSPASSSSTSDLNDVLMTMARASSCPTLPGSSSVVAFGSATTLPHTIILTTDILPVVSVPVLSEQIVVALPIVSHADDVLTMFMSVIIFLTEKANAIVTARGRPSGTATTKMVMPVIRKVIHCELCTALSHSSLQHALVEKSTAKRMKRMMMMPIPKHAPILVIMIVMSSSFTCRMERPPSSSSSPPPLSSIRICSYVLRPTAMTSILPSPSCTSVPLNTRGVLSGVGSYLAARASGVSPGTFICCRSRSGGTEKWPFSLNS